MFAEPLGYGRDRLAIGRLGRPRASHCHRLQVLTAHQGAEACSPGSPVDVIHNGSEAYPVLPGDADLRDLHPVIAQLFTELRLYFGGFAAPQVRGGADLNSAVLDPQIDWLVGPTMNHQGIEASHLQLIAPPAAGLAAAQRAGQRRFAGNSVPPGARKIGALKNPWSEDQQVVGAQGIDAGRQVTQQQVSCQCPPAHEQAQDLGIKHLYVNPPSGQVNVG